MTKLILQQDTFNHLRESIIAHRIVTEVYEQEYDLPNAITTAQNGLALVLKMEENIGRAMPK